MAGKPDDGDTHANHKQAIRDGIDDARARAGRAAQAAVGLTKDGLDQARASLSGAYATGLDKASGARRTAAEGLSGNPLAAVIGGLAVGAAIGALLPRTESEAQALGPLGDRLRDAAREALDAARAAGRDKLDELGLNREHAGDTVKSLLDDIVAAAGSAGSAAFEAARNKPAA